MFLSPPREIYASGGGLHVAPVTRHTSVLVGLFERVIKRANEVTRLLLFVCGTIGSGN